MWLRSMLTFRQWIKKSVIKRVPVKGSNLILLKIIFRIKWSTDMMRSKAEIKIKGARNDLSFFRKPIITKIDDKTPKHENPKYITLNHNVTIERKITWLIFVCVKLLITNSLGVSPKKLLLVNLSTFPDKYSRSS